MKRDMSVYEGKEVYNHGERDNKIVLYRLTLEYVSVSFRLCF